MPLTDLLVTLAMLVTAVTLVIVASRKDKRKQEPIEVGENISIELIKTSDNKYRLKIINEKEISYVSSYATDYYAFINMQFPENISSLKLRPAPYIPYIGIGTDFTKDCIPNLREIIKYYEKYKTIGVVANEVVETVVVSKKQPKLSEDQLTLLNLVPKLIEADKAGDKQKANDLLDQMYSLNLIPNGQENKETVRTSSS